MAEPLSLRLLGQKITPEVAAELLEADPEWFDGVAELTLLSAFKAVFRPAMMGRHHRNGRKRAAMRSATAAARREAASVNEDRLDLAIRATARQMAGRIEEELALLALIDPKAAVRLRDASASAVAFIGKKDRENA